MAMVRWALKLCIAKIVWKAIQSTVFMRFFNNIPVEVLAKATETRKVSKVTPQQVGAATVKEAKQDKRNIELRFIFFEMKL